MQFYEYKKAFFIVWIILSTGIVLLLLSPFVINDKTLLSYSPTCFSKTKYTMECFFCGMTGAFLAISKGSFQEARLLNTGSLGVYFLFVLNTVFFMGYFIYLYFIMSQKRKESAK